MVIIMLCILRAGTNQTHEKSAVRVSKTERIPRVTEHQSLDMTFVFMNARLSPFFKNNVCPQMMFSLELKQ